VVAVVSSLMVTVCISPVASLPMLLNLRRAGEDAAEEEDDAANSEAH
jgi:hypothetical protein